MKYTILRPPLSARFQLPTKEDLFKVVVGDHVKLIFQVGSDIAERMWVKVEECYDSDVWTGVLDNEPIGEVNSKVLRLGKKIKFHPYDVIDVMSEEAFLLAMPPTAPSETMKWYRNPTIVVPAIVAIIVAIIGLFHV